MDSREDLLELPDSQSEMEVRSDEINLTQMDNGSGSVAGTKGSTSSEEITSSHPSASQESSDVTDSSLGEGHLWINNPITTEAEWDEYFSRSLQTSENYDLPISLHTNVWVTVIEWAMVMNRQMLLPRCLFIWIDTMPAALESEASENNMLTFLDMVYKYLDTGAVSPEDVKPALDRAESKFALSYVRAPAYWRALRKREKQLFKDKRISKDEYVTHLIAIYQKELSRFSFDLDTAYTEFKDLCKKEGIDKELQLELQASYLSNAQDKHHNHQSIDTSMHHAHMDLHISEIIENKCATVDQIRTLSEDLIFKDITSICFHFTYIKALNSEMFSTHPKRNILLFSGIKRALRHGTTGCNNMLVYFLNYALRVSLLNLEVNETTEIINHMMKKFPLAKSIPMWFSSRKTIIFTLKDLACAYKISEEEFITAIEAVLSPIPLDYFSKDECPEELVEYIDHELKFFDLIKVAFLSKCKVGKKSKENTAQLWQDNLKRIDNPQILVPFVESVRGLGSAKVTVEAFKKAVNLIKEYNKNELKSSFVTRTIEMQLLNRSLEFRMLECSNVDEEISLLHDMNLTNSLYSSVYLESYDIQSSEFPAVVDDRYPSSQEGTSRSSYQSQSSQTSSDDMSVTSHLRKVTISDADDWTLTLTNLAYTATENDIIKAFEDKGLNVVNVYIKTNSKGRSRGTAKVKLDTEDAVLRAITDFRTLEIANRLTTLSSSAHSTPRQSYPEATAVILSGLPPEWRDPNKIMTALAAFGHIKSVAVDDKREPATSKIVYNFKEDAFIGLEKAQELWKDQGISARLGFPGKDTKQPREGKRSRTKESPSNTPRLRNPPSNIDQPISSVSSKKMRRKLNIFKRKHEQEAGEGSDDNVTKPKQSKMGPTNESPTKPSSSKAGDPTTRQSKKRVAESSTSSSSTLTNEDFRKMLKK